MQVVTILSPHRVAVARDGVEVVRSKPQVLRRLAELLSRGDIEALGKTLVAPPEADAEGIAREIHSIEAGVVDWIKRFRALGGTRVIVTTEHEWLLDAGFALYVPLPPGAPSKRVRKRRRA